MRPDLHYAVVVGINKYPAFPALRGPQNDAKEFVKWLKDDAKLPEENIGWIQVDEGAFDSVEKAIPTRREIDDAIESAIRTVRAKLKEKPEDWAETRLYLYFSGHGIAQTARETSVLMANARRGRLGESIACGAYANYFEDSQTFAEVIVFADCCRSTERKAQIIGPPFDSESASRGKVRTLVAFATGFGDLAYEPTPEEVADPDLTRGYFTVALLEALRGAVDEESNDVNSRSVEKYVKARVAELTKHRPVPQYPVMVNPEKIVFRSAAAAPPVQKFAARIVFPAGFSGKVVLSDSAFQQVDSHDAADGAEWVVELPPGVYEVRPENEPTGARFNGDGLFRLWGGPRDVKL